MATDLSSPAVAIIGPLIGAVVTYLVLTRYYQYRKSLDAKQKRERLINELEYNRSKIAEKMKVDLAPIRTTREYYLLARKELIEITDSKTWQSVQTAYLDINALKYKESAIETNFKKSLASIEKAILSLSHQRDLKLAEVVDGDRDQNEKLAPADSLRLAYEELVKDTRSRETSTLTVVSILFSASLLLVGLSFDLNVRKGASILPYLGAAALPLSASVVMILAFVYWITVWSIDQVYFKHISDLEGRLGITEGHSKIARNLKQSRWFKIRRKYLPFLFFLVIVLYLILTFYYYCGLVVTC